MEKTEEMEMERKKRNFKVVAVVVLVIAFALFWHPWINQETVERAFLEFYGTNIYEVRLTEWSPFGHEFVVYLSNSDVMVGRGLVNLWGRIIEFEFLWAET